MKKGQRTMAVATIYPGQTKPIAERKLKARQSF
jgi:hypothetical protein